MAYINDGSNCCGLREISGLSEEKDPVLSMRRIVKQMYADIKPKPKSKVTADEVKAKIDAYVKEHGPTDGVWLRTTWGDEYAVNALGRTVYKMDLEEDARYQFDPAYNDDDSYNSYDDHHWRYAVFTQAGSNQTYGKQFAAFIEDHKLGEVVQATTKTVKNPNSGNILKAWLWTVNHRNLRNWAKKNL